MLGYLFIFIVRDKSRALFSGFRGQLPGIPLAPELPFTTLIYIPNIHFLVFFQLLFCAGVPCDLIGFNRALRKYQQG